MCLGWLCTTLEGAITAFQEIAGWADNDKRCQINFKVFLVGGAFAAIVEGHVSSQYSYH